MKLTICQRVAALERENVVLQGKIELLHKLLKQQRQLIQEYITWRVAMAEESERQGRRGSEDAVYIFMCRQRFDRIEKGLERLEKIVAGTRGGCKAG